MVFVSSPAVAAQSHGFLSFFGSRGSAAGQVELSFESGLAVNQASGDVYVADTGNHRVDEFSESGTFIQAWGWGVKAGDISSTGLDTCTIATGCQAGFSGAGTGQFENPTFVAVDNTPGGSSDVYVADLGSQTNARQTVTVGGATGGAYALSFTSTLHGTITAGSDLVTAVQGPEEIGAVISGPGIPSGTTIVGRLETLESFTLSANATVSGREVLGATGTTVPIQYNASAAEVQATLENIRGLDRWVSVSGGVGGPYTIEFVGGLVDTKIPQMTCDGSGLSPSGATCTVASVVEGKDSARVEKFDSSGGLIASWGGTPASGQLDGSTCSKCGDNPRFGRVEGIAIQPGGNLLVLGGPLESETIGPYLTEWSQSSGEFVETVATFGYSAPVGMAFDPAGHLYMGKLSNEVVGSGSHFEVIQTSLTLSEGEPAYHENFVVDSGPATGVAVDPSDENVYVARFNPVSNQSEVAGYAPLGELFESFGGDGEIGRPAGIAVSGLNSDVYVADPGAGHIELFVSGGSRDVLSVTRTGTTLGSVSSAPAGIACPSRCSAGFPEGETVVLTAVAPLHSTFVGWSGGGCSGTMPCQLSLTAATAVGAVFAQDRPVLAAPVASAVARNTATVSGTVNPEGDASSCLFEYGTTSAYGAEAPCSTRPGSVASPVAVSAELWDLAASTTYHYRLVSANSGGVMESADQTFTTVSESCASNSVLCSAPGATSSLLNEGLLNEGLVSLKHVRTLTNAQKLAQALKVCKKYRRKSIRVSCEKRARERYTPAKKKTGKPTQSKKREVRR